MTEKQKLNKEAVDLLIKAFRRGIITESEMYVKAKDYGFSQTEVDQLIDPSTKT